MSGFGDLFGKVDLVLMLEVQRLGESALTPDSCPLVDAHVVEDGVQPSPDSVLTGRTKVPDTLERPPEGLLASVLWLPERS